MPSVCVPAGTPPPPPAPPAAGQTGEFSLQGTWKGTGTDSVTVAFAPPGVVDPTQSPNSANPLIVTYPTTSYLFNVAVLAQPADNQYTMTITAKGGSIMTSVLVAPAIQSLSPDQGSAAPGANLGWSVALDRPTPPGGQVVDLSSATPAQFASFPATIVVPAGALVATFNTTIAASASGVGSITASCNGTSQTGDVMIP